MRVGIFGGTFDPIHKAHLAIAREARDTFDLDRVLVIPAANPPHKPGATASYEHRYRMVELACEGEANLEPSRLEEAEERSYSITTIGKIRNLYPSAVLFFLIGSDAFAEIRSWHRWQDIVASVEFIVFTRPCAMRINIPDARVHKLESVDMPISSSEIRLGLARGERREELPDAVYQYIVQNGLYS